MWDDLRKDFWEGEETEHLEAYEVEISNPQLEHMPVIFLVDVSSSTEGKPNEQINKALKNFIDSLWVNDDGIKSMRKKLDLCVITYGSNVTVQLPFTNGDHIRDISPFPAGGCTPMGEAILKACEMMKKQLKAYYTKGIGAYTGVIFNLTDGAPTDMQPGDPMWTKVKQAISELESMGSKGNAYALFFNVGCDGANMELLDQLGFRNKAKRMRGIKFQEFMNWVRLSLVKISWSKPEESVALPPTDEWSL